MSKTVHLSNLSDAVEPDEIERLCAAVGRVVEVDMPLGLTPTALVTFATANDAQAALARLDGYPLHGQPMRVALGGPVLFADGSATPGPRRSSRPPV